MKSFMYQISPSWRKLDLENTGQDKEHLTHRLDMISITASDSSNMFQSELHGRNVSSPQVGCLRQKG